MDGYSCKVTIIIIRCGFKCEINFVLDALDSTAALLSIHTIGFIHQQIKILTNFVYNIL